MVGDRVVHGYASGRDAVRLMTASFRTHHFVPHDHAEYAVAAVERGVEAVRYRGATHHAGVGNLLLLDAEVLHAGRPGVAEGWDYRVFYVPPALLAEIAGAPPALADPTPYDPGLARALSLVHRRLQDGDGDVTATQERLHEVLIAVVQRYAHGSASGDRTSRAEVRRVQRYLAADLHARPGLDDLAAVAGLPRHRLLRAFRRETGLSPHGYLTQLRLRRAQQLLTAGSTVARAATEAGFHDQSHLTRHFRRTFAAPPGRFARSRHRVQDPRSPVP